MDLINEIKKKKEFSKIPDSIIQKYIDKVPKDLDQKSIIKEVRKNLRKYFGVFLTNKVVKPKNLADYDSILKNHKSSKNRNYENFYNLIKNSFDFDDVSSIIDLGCGMNGFSYPYINESFGDVEYVGVEATGQIVDLTNDFYALKNFSKPKLYCMDLFDTDSIKNLIKKRKEKRLIFLFQVIDALENIQKDFSKEFLLKLKDLSSFIIITLPLKSISSKKVFEVKRTWLSNFLTQNFTVIDDFNISDERIFVIKC